MLLDNHITLTSFLIGAMWKEIIEQQQQLGKVLLEKKKNVV